MSASAPIVKPDTIIWDDWPAGHWAALLFQQLTTALYVRLWPAQLHSLSLYYSLAYGSIC